MLFLAIFIACVLAVIAAIHFYWAVKGGEMASAKVIPYRDGVPVLTPSRFGTFLVSVALFCMAVFVVTLGFYRPSFLPNWFWLAGGIVLSLVFIGRAIGDFRFVGFFKKIKNSEFALYDTRYWSPLCLVLGLGILLLTLY